MSKLLRAVLRTESQQCSWRHNYAWFAWAAQDWDELNRQIPLLGEINHAYFGARISMIACWPKVPQAPAQNNLAGKKTGTPALRPSLNSTKAGLHPKTSGYSARPMKKSQPAEGNRFPMISRRLLETLKVRFEENREDTRRWNGTDGASGFVARCPEIAFGDGANRG